MRLNQTAAALLESCRDWKTTGDLTQNGNLKKAHIEKLLPNLAARQLLEIQPIAPKVDDLPMVSVIVPVRNRPKDIVACVASLQKLNYPAEKLEIIVVDDASTDNTSEVVAKLPVRNICLQEWEAQLPARNAGATVASGEILAYTDSDCEVDRNWLRDLVPHFKGEQIWCSGRRKVELFSLDTPIERYESVASSLYMGEEERDLNRIRLFHFCQRLTCLFDANFGGSWGALTRPFR